ncbi:MAG TPA: hypothetical protein VJQ54_10625 [Candidatus Sulfotelmatobacter sp.]|nr:hypothetical protein [Candidatus Sulfotelmatobacter sp.]
MKASLVLLITVAMLPALPALAKGKKHPDRAMIEKMEAVPCGARERGLTGLGSVFASVGATHVNSDEKLCPQYMLRTDDMEYHVRPLDKHPRLLPVGQEGEIKLSKDVLVMKIPDGDHKKRRYQVVGMKPVDHTESTSGAGTDARYVPHHDNYERQPQPQSTKVPAEKTDARAPLPTPPQPN